MTALQEYQRLECTGLWRDRPDGQRREVIVSFGEATLVISEMRSERALTHWSLPAVVRLNPGELPARFSPDPDGDEELELDDEAMIAAVSKVHTLIEARRPHPGRLRTALLGSALAGVCAALLFWVPNALVTHTAAALPFAKRQAIGRAALADLTRLTGQPCAASEGQDALGRLHDRLLGPAGEIFVLPEGLKRSAVLPGGIVLLSRALVEDQDTPEVAAGEVLAADLRRVAQDPMVAILRHAGIRATFRLLTTGDLPNGSVDGYGEELLSANVEPATEKALLDRFRAAGVASGPYAYFLDPTGESVLALIEADPFRAVSSNRPVMSDADWVSLQGICRG
ncbi:hypothetical protein [Defluviimonas sp. SAOS-178_SWC]|uniref:hypothetical protein n=1 Tax=Defluviimonas sp. SAOS-178_SWC TaxID=3121287 RepID=UPI00322205F5